MSSTPEQKEKRRYRRRSRIKDLKTPKYQRIVEDKHGNKHDLSTMTHRDLIEAIQETE